MLVALEPPPHRRRPTPQVDESNPWPGLAAFTECDQAYFHGREQELDQLAGRVDSDRLVVLFGLSGLGKTSLLRAGLFPRLRPRMLPVYVRLDFDGDSPALVEQVLRAI